MQQPLTTWWKEFYMISEIYFCNENINPFFFLKKDREPPENGGPPYENIYPLIYEHTQIEIEIERAREREIQQ